MGRAIKHWVVALIGVGILLILFVFGPRWLSLVSNQTFSAAEQDVKREVFTHSASYVQGMNQELYKLQQEYLTAETAENKRAIRSLILHRVGAIDTSMLPSDLQDFVSSLRLAY